MTRSLKGKVALVTGSTSGIGLGIARALARAGADIMLNGLGDTGANEKMRADLAAEAGVRVAFNGADLSRDDQVQIIDDTVARLGSVDILVNNAGIQHVAPIDEFPLEKWDLIQTLMLKSPFLLIRAALPHMKARNWGRIINISSVHGKVASVNKSAYVAAKHGLVGLSKVVALETATTGITSNCICPGFALTPLVSKQVDAIAERDGISWDAAREKLLAEKQPSRDFVATEAIGAAAVYLCGDMAAQMRGTEMVIDGGWTAQ
jgi:3-hydroxybutyrate dehydrogenase